MHLFLSTLKFRRLKFKLCLVQNFVWEKSEEGKLIDLRNKFRTNSKHNIGTGLLEWNIL